VTVGTRECPWGWLGSCPREIWPPRAPADEDASAVAVATAILTPVPSHFRDPDAPQPNIPRRIGVIALVERDGALLLQRRADDGDWDFVGGNLEEDETVLDALHREIREETGLEIRNATFFGVFSDPARIVTYPDGKSCHLLTLVFRVEPEPGVEPRRSPESLELRFVDRAELTRIDLWPSSRPIRDAFLGDPPDIVVV
jgi:8-oxo-dGTP pyrophosphatase MutT (NUDIX family)